MNTSMIDRITRSMARRTSRRTLVKSVSGGALASAGLLAGASSAGAAIGERSVLFYEFMAESLVAERGDCASIAQAAKEFQTQNAELMAELQAEEQSWTSAHRIEHHEAYAERISRATAMLHSAATHCGFQANSTSQFCSADAVEPSESTPVAKAMRAIPQAQADACHGCDIQCICVDHPPTSGDCWLSTLGCLGGSRGSCCWSGICMFWSTSYCQYQAQNCCNL